MKKAISQARHKDRVGEFDNVRTIIARFQRALRGRLEDSQIRQGGLTLDRYVRYLSMQYHLTNGVQRHFFACAGHPDLEKRRSLRDFLCKFANQEELHYLIAEKDLGKLHRKVLPCPIDVKLWWAFFNSIVHERPFIRLGATTVLENIASQSADVIARLFADATYITARNSQFLIIHQHNEDLPHGDQILAALEEARLEAHHLADLEEGAEIGGTLYLRMADWALS